MNPSPLPRAGVLGLGLIGSRVAVRLAEAGFPLAVWNRTSRDFTGLPSPRATPGEVAAGADILQIFVADDDALASTVRAMQPALGPQHIILSHATVAPQTVLDLAGEVSAAGAAFLDAPFTGSRDAAAAGKITYYIGGEPRALDRARPVLEASARAIMPCGEVGQASTLKIALNIIASAAAASLAEAVNLLRSNGVDPSILPAVLETNAARSGVTDLKLPCMLDGDFAPRFSSRNMRKDMRLAADLAAPAHRALTRALLETFEAACRQGFADEDFAAAVKTKTG